jgi:hypothetical protein
VVEGQAAQAVQVVQDDLEEHQAKHHSNQLHQQATSKPWDSYPKYSWVIMPRQTTSLRKLKDIYTSTKMWWDLTYQQKR